MTADVVVGAILMTLPVIVLLGGVTGFLWRDSRSDRQGTSWRGTAAGRGHLTPELIDRGRADLSIAQEAGTPAPSDTEEQLPAEARPDALARPTSERQLEERLLQSYDFGLWRSRRLQLMAMLIGAVGVVLVYTGVMISLGVPLPLERPHSITAGALSAIGGLSIGLVTGTFLREARLAQDDLAEQRVHMQAYLREVRREQMGLRTLSELAAGQVRSTAAARISELLVTETSSKATKERKPSSRNGRSSGSRGASHPATPTTRRRPPSKRSRGRDDGAKGLTELDLSAAEALDEEQSR